MASEAKWCFARRAGARASMTVFEAALPHASSSILHAGASFHSSCASCVSANSAATAQRRARQRRSSLALTLRV
eukprot:3934484-Pleurochrysis_carterae.AAC.2